jgi:hypothetical protein
MTTHEMPDPAASRDIYGKRLRIGIGLFLAVAVFFLWQDHRMHLLGVLPWLLLLACPLMHFFMHRGHRSHHHDQTPRSGGKPAETQDGHEHAGHGCC